MKAKFFLLGLCALGLAACSIDEVSQINDTNAVTFKATTITRADVTTTNNLQAFSVWAWNGDNEFMDDVIATRSGSSSTFTTSPLYFWPTGTVDFYALAPATGVTAIEDNVEYAFLGGEINEGDDVNPNWTYEGYVAKAQIANGNIVIDACIPSLPEDQIDLCYGVALEKSSGSVPMNFRHALSQIAFKAKSANTAFDVKIADVSVCSVYKEGVYTIGDNDTSTHLDEGTSTSPATGTQGAWVLTTTDDSGYAIKGRYLVDMTSSVVDVPTDGDVVELVDPKGTLMLLPQTIVAWDPLTDYSDTELGSYLRILCHVEESGSQLWPNNAAEDEETDLEATGAFKTIDGVEYAEIAIPLTNVEWEQGYRYTYTLIFGEGLGYYPPDDPNTDLEGKPVLDIITFDVTVDEFQDAENVDNQYDLPTDTDLSYIEVSTQAELEGAIHMGYQEIKLEADITLEDHNLVFDYDCVLDLNDYTLTGVDYTADSNPCGSGSNSVIFITAGTLTVNGPGTIMTNGTASDDNGGYGSGDTDVFWVAGGNLIINGGTYYGGSWQDSTGGTYAASSSCVYVTEGFAYIYAGEFYSGWSKTLGAITILNCKNTPWEDGIANIYCYGGSYAWDPSYCTNGPDYGFVADGYGVVYNEETELYDVVYTTVTSAADLRTLIDEGASEITLDADIVLEDHNLYFTEDCVLDLNGHTLTGIDVADDEDCSNANSVIFVNGGTLTVNGPGTITTEGSGKGADGSGTGSGDTSIFWLNGGDLIINGGTYNGGSWKDTAGEDYTDSSATVYVQSGFAYIYDGTFTCGVAAAFKSDGWKTAEGYTESIINIYDSARNTDPKTGWAYVYGGTYRNFDPGNNPCEGANTDFCADGYASDEGVVDADGNTWFTVAAK